ncbi:MAG: (5-formylfuran-3-yl)methyl phosphate synthase [Planctomycetaceae bacterium]
MRTEVVPRLLVSVRSAAEAAAAIAGGCDVLDVKEPSRGSLGMADAGTMEAVGRVALDSARPSVVSVALGELAEWSDDRPIPKLPASITFAKVGLHGSRNDVDWPRKWRLLRERFEAVAGRELSWIAVIYADSAAEAPAGATVIEAATPLGCRGVLVDTFLKNGPRLLDHVAPERLAEWRSLSHAAGLQFAVAGSLRVADLPRLDEVRPDIVAVRGAACRDGVRDGTVCTDAVRRFRSALMELDGRELPSESDR